MRRRRTVLLGGSVLTLTLLLMAGAPAAPALRRSRAAVGWHQPDCMPSAAPANQPTIGQSRPPAAPRYLPGDFPRFSDDVWADLIGGIGGLTRHAPLTHTPVIFVHGNQADAQNWLDAMQQFHADAGYQIQDMYAISYNGLGNYWAGAPDTVGPTALDQAYIAQNSNALGNGGHGAADDDEVPDLCRFVEAVQSYTGSRQVDIVAHSLGVTITRRFMQLYPTLAADVVAFVGIAGANHGTSICRGLDTTYYGCNEIAPGSPWLARLNASGETYRPTAWMTVYNGVAGDPFFDPPLDEGSPALAGADNRSFPLAYHNDLRVGPAEVDAYLPFLLRRGQAGPGASHNGPAQAAQIEATQPDGLQGPALCVPGLNDGGHGCPPA